MKYLQRLLFWIYPPLELRRANRYLDDEISKIDLGKKAKEFRKALRSNKEKPNYYQLLLQEATTIYDDELLRRRDIESKAQNLAGAVGISLSIIGLASGSSFLQSCNRTVLTWVGLLFLVLASLHLLLAGFFAVKTTLLEGYYSYSPDTILPEVGGKKKDVKRLAAMKLAMVKSNSLSIIKKTNYLSVSQSFFLRGLTLLGLAIALGLIIQLL